MISPIQDVQTRPEELELLDEVLDALLEELLEELLDELLDELFEELAEELLELELSSSPPQPDKLNVDTTTASKVILIPRNRAVLIIEGLFRVFTIIHMMIDSIPFENAS